MSEQEDFEFRMRMEQEAGAEQEMPTPPIEPPSALAVAGNAAYKGLAGTGDFFLNIAGAVGNALIPPPLRPGALQDPIRTGMEEAGLIKPEHEPQTPGQRILDMAVQAGVGTAIAPAQGLAGVARNVGMGVLSGTTAGITKEATGSDLAATVVGVATPLIAYSMIGSTANKPTLSSPVKTATLRDAQQAGYVVPPSQVKPSATTNKLEGIAGKASIRQEAAIRNQEVTNALAVKALGLPEGTPLTKDTIVQVREAAAQPYREVAALSPKAAEILDKLKQARADATAYFTHYNRSADPASLKKAQALRTKVGLYETQIENIASSSGGPAVSTSPDLMTRLRSARQFIAKTYDVERATNFADGNVNAQVLGAIAKKGKPLSGELGIIARFAQAFPSVTRPGASIPASGVSGTDAAASALLATVGYGAAGGPAGLAAGGLPLIRGAVRPALLSGMYQKGLLKEPPSLNQALLRSILAGRAVSDAAAER